MESDEYWLTGCRLQVAGPYDVVTVYLMGFFHKRFLFTKNLGPLKFFVKKNLIKKTQLPLQGGHFSFSSVSSLL